MLLANTDLCRKEIGYEGSSFRFALSAVSSFEAMFSFSSNAFFMVRDSERDIHKRWNQREAFSAGIADDNSRRVWSYEV